MPATLTVPVEGRVPARTKVRLKVGWVLAHLGLLAMTEHVVRRLAYDVRIGRGRWRRQYIDVTIEEE